MKTKEVKTTSKTHRKKNSLGGYNNKAYFMMALPGMLHGLIFCYLPLIGILIAFKDIDYSLGILKSPWCGLRNFKFLFSSPDTGIIFRNTLCYGAVGIILGAICPVALAVAFTKLRSKCVSKAYQTIAMLPYFISWIIVSYIVASFFDYKFGALNHLMKNLGREPIDWYSEIKVWPFLLVFLNLWKGLGYNAVVYIASIAGIDASLYEAAAIDGATSHQQTWYITLPQLSNIIAIMLIMSIGGLITSNFDLFYAVPKESGALFPVTNVINTFVYRSLKINNDIGMSSAAGLLQSVIGFILVTSSNFIMGKIDEDKAMF